MILIETFPQLIKATTGNNRVIIPGRKTKRRKRMKKMSKKSMLIRKLSKAKKVEIYF